MGEWIRWIVGLTVTILLLIVPAVVKMYSLLQLLVERMANTNQAVIAEQTARLAADNDQCRRINAIEDTLDHQGRMLDRIDERTGWIVTGLQRAGVVDNHNK